MIADHMTADTGLAVTLNPECWSPVPRLHTLIVLVFATIASVPSGLAAEINDRPWRLDSDSNGLKIYSRLRPGSALKEFKAIGNFDAPTRVVHNVLDDVEGYPRFMPYVAACRILKRNGNSIYAYQRISPGIVSDRDYTLHIEEESWTVEGGTVYWKHWQQANDAGPPPQKGVLRVQLCQGSWLLEPEPGDKTRATYSVYTDTGGRLPAFIANVASGIGIRKVFAAIRNQVKDPKYLADRDFLEPDR
jgi:hypothetical protein